MRQRSVLWLAVGIFGITAALDWWTKVLALTHLQETAFTVVPGWASFRLAFNRGVAFSALEGVPHQVLGVGAILLLAVVVWSLRHLAARPLGASALAMVAAGGLCNAIDRLADGQVTDMISVWRWPIFNVADSAITVGVALLLLATRKPKAEREAEASSSASA